MSRTDGWASSIPGGEFAGRGRRRDGGRRSRTGTGSSEPETRPAEQTEPWARGVRYSVVRRLSPSRRCRTRGEPLGRRDYSGFAERPKSCGHASGPATVSDDVAPPSARWLRRLLAAWGCRALAERARSVRCERWCPGPSVVVRACRSIVAEVGEVGVPFGGGEVASGEAACGGGRCSGSRSQMAMPLPSPKATARPSGRRERGVGGEQLDRDRVAEAGAAGDVVDGGCPCDTATSSLPSALNCIRADEPASAPGKLPSGVSVSRSYSVISPTVLAATSVPSGASAAVLTSSRLADLFTGAAVVQRHRPDPAPVAESATATREPSLARRDRPDRHRSFR